MKKSGFAKGVIWTLTTGIVLVVILAAVGIVAYNSYTDAALEASYSRGNTETKIKIEKKDKNSETAKVIETKKLPKKLKFTEHGSFYGIKKDGKMVRGIQIGPETDTGQSTWYGAFTKSQGYWKGYFAHSYSDGRKLYNYSHYKLDSDGNLIVDKDGIYEFVDTYPISEKDFEKVKEYIHLDMDFPFSFYDFEDPEKQVAEKTIGCIAGNCTSGQGTYVWDTGSKYVGKWKDSEEHGQGTWTNDGRKYVGEYKNGKKHGQGTYTWPNGEKYVGEFKNGQVDGHGTSTFPTGTKYVGEFEGGIRNGQGTLTRADGGKYVGEFLDGQKNGQGTFTWTSGEKYVGEFKSGTQHGQGTVTWPNGKKWVGKFIENKPDGKGTWTDIDGSTYVAEMKKELVDEIFSEKKITTDEKYYALVIGNNNYEHLEKLDAAENDAKVLANVLQDKYGFEVDLLLNADYDTTVNSLFKITNKLKSNDNLLIYYAGHGELDKAENRGYWLPVDASYELRSKWISNQRIVDRIKATKAKHVLLMVDSCFSGTLMRSGTTPEIKETIDEKYIERLKKKKTRLVITSGGEEPVVDSDGGQHSLFALKLIDTLKNNKTVINSQILFENIRRYVVVNADQTPERAIVHKTGDDGGDFLFFAKN